MFLFEIYYITGSMINFTNCSNIHLGNALVFQAEKTVIHGKKYEEKETFNKNEMQKDSSVLQLMDCNDEVTLHKLFIHMYIFFLIE